jgi:uncharacterized protein (DUF2345 family)
VRSGTSWKKQATLTPSGGTAGDFGSSVALSGSTAVIGATGKNSFTGAAYVFVRSGTSWKQQAKLSASDGAAGDVFGSSVAISGSTAVIGARSANSVGAAYVFVRSGTTWSQQAKLTASHRTVGAFGSSVAVHGSTALVGDPVGPLQRGAAYVFVRAGSTWSRQAKLPASNATECESFASSVALSRSTALIGAPGKKYNAGAAYVFARSKTAWPRQAKLTASRRRRVPLPPRLPGGDLRLDRSRQRTVQRRSWGRA